MVDHVLHIMKKMRFRWERLRIIKKLHDNTLSGAPWVYTSCLIYAVENRRKYFTLSTAPGFAQWSNHISVFRWIEFNCIYDSNHSWACCYIASRSMMGGDVIWWDEIASAKYSKISVAYSRPLSSIPKCVSSHPISSTSFPLPPLHTKWDTGPLAFEIILRSISIVPCHRIQNTRQPNSATVLIAFDNDTHPLMASLLLVTLTHKLNLHIYIETREPNREKKCSKGKHE